MDPQTRLRLTTNPGLEDLVLRELRARVGPGVEAHGDLTTPSGRVEVTLPMDRSDALAAARALSSVHHVLRPIARLELEDGADRDGALRAVRGAVAAQDIPELEAAATFRASSRRRGTHPFSSEDVARFAGAGALDRYPHLAVDLEGYAVNLRADLRDRTLDLAIQHTHRALSKRRAGPYRPRVALKAPVAWALLQLAAEALGRPPRLLLDPCCGSATLLREAGALWPDCALRGSDAFEKPLAGAQSNIDALGLAPRTELRHVDFRALRAGWPELGPDNLDLIVANPPYGRRLGARTDLYALYRGLLLEAAEMLAPGRRLVLLATARERLNRAIKHTPAWHTVGVRVVETGGIWPLVVVLERRA